MNGIFNKYLDQFVFIFIDDILIYSKTEEEHQHHLWIVLQTLREHQLYAELGRCEFFKTKIQYLGHVIPKDGIAVDPQKIKAISDLPIPKDVANIRSFMGLTGYYRRFIEGLSRISYPITSLQRKGVKFVCSSKCQEIFDKIKDLLTKAPIPKVADP